MRESCLNCTRKHLAQALVLIIESKTGYPEHRWLAIGHMAEAEAESVLDYPDLANTIREHRLSYMEDEKYVPNLMSVIELATFIAENNEELQDQENSKQNGEQNVDSE